MLVFKPFSSTNPYDINLHIDGDLQDTLLVNVVTYMGPKHRYADNLTRHQSHFRKYYIEMARDYTFHKYFIDQNDIHYFYVIRPARHPIGNRRAVGGKMKLDKDMNIFDYEEIFVTHVLDEDTLKKYASGFFDSMIEGNYQELNHSNKFIEWPDDRLQYDFVKKEWRYDVVDKQ